MNAAYRFVWSVALGGALFSTASQAASWQDSLTSAASELSGQSSPPTQGGMSLSSLTSLLGGDAQALSAGSINNAAGIIQYCVKQQLTTAASAENIKNQMLDKLGLGTAEQQKDTAYLDGIQGLLNAQSGQQLDLNTIGNSSLAEQVKTKACDLVLKQGVNFLS